jgi:hypothetical protein
MGFQNKNGSVSVFAKLTDLGKKYLLTDQQRFQISKFSPLDDEIDYSLWNTSHDDGINYFGAGIESLPMLEPVASSIFQAKYNLIKDMDRGTLRMPIFTLNPTSVTLDYIDSVVQLNVQIQNIDEPTVKVILLDNTKADISAPGAQLIDVNPLAVQNFIGQSGFTYAKAFQVSTGATIEVTALRNENNFDVTTKIIIIGTTTNARSEVPVTIQPNTVITT